MSLSELSWDPNIALIPDFGDELRFLFCVKSVQHKCVTFDIDNQPDSKSVSPSGRGAEIWHMLMSSSETSVIVS